MLILEVNKSTDGSFVDLKFSGEGTVKHYQFKENQASTVATYIKRYEPDKVKYNHLEFSLEVTEELEKLK